jgi:cellulose synthase (UDP-forming)
VKPELKEYYFSKFENRKPYPPVKDNLYRTLLFQFFAIITLGLGLAYLHWRWVYSLNPQALWFAYPLVIAETLSFIGTALIIYNLWAFKDPNKEPPVHMLSEIEDLNGRKDRPIRIDVFIATYNEDVEIVRYSIRDAKDMRYPYSDVQVKVFVLDDGRRDGTDSSKENMKLVAEEEGAGYLVRSGNEGYKAGNLKNAVEQTNSDIFVILDADTRPLIGFLENTTGYFRNKKVAWVQTPQWFYDTTIPRPLKNVLAKNLGKIGYFIGNAFEKVVGEILIGDDIFGNDPRLFYDILLRKRNNYNAAFCCGAGSIHRREAVMSLALRGYVEDVNFGMDESIKKNHKKIISAKTLEEQKKQLMVKMQLIPFKFHASEDIYTSMMLHSDNKNKWISIQHAGVEAKMLSPQDIDTVVKQRTRYAAGSLDIAFKENPLFINGLTIWQRLAYFTTIYSYLAPLWILVFLLSPIVFFFTQALPVSAYSFDFFKYFLPFQIFNTIIMSLGAWGVNTSRGDQYYISSFWLMLLSLWSALRGEKVKFNVTPKIKQGGGKYMQHIWPHLTIIILTLTGIVYNIVLIYFNAHPSTSGFVSNAFWSVFNIWNLSVMIRAAYWNEEEPHLANGTILEKNKQKQTVPELSVS